MSKPPRTVYPDPDRPPRAAAAVILLREGPSPQVFMVRRNPKLRFLGGFGGYPGGRVDQQDADIAGLEDRTAHPVAQVAAARELFEEAGVLICPGAEALPDDRLDRARKALLESKAVFAEVCEDLGVDPRPAPGTLMPAGRWVTPFYSPLRFDTRYYVHRYQGSREPSVWHGELVEGWWSTPVAVVDAWKRWERWLAPPVTETLLEMAGNADDLDDLCARLDRLSDKRGHAYHPVRMRYGVRMLPLRSRTLPPAVFTNTFLVGEEELVVVDPGAAEGEPRRVLLEQVDALLAQGRRLKCVLLTHHHLDHMDSAAAVRQRYDVPIAAHRLNAGICSVRIDRELEHGQRIGLAGGFVLEVRHTPGHAQGHVCFLEHRSGSLFAGDLVNGLGPVTVEPVGFDEQAHQQSVRAAMELGDLGLFPGHGPPRPSSVAFLSGLVAEG